MSAQLCAADEATLTQWAAAGGVPDDHGTRQFVADHLLLKLWAAHQELAACVGELAAEPSIEADQLARLFHETYERLAPTFGYETRKASAVPWDDVPDQNKRLMVAVASEVLREFRRSGSASADTQEAP